MIAWRRSALLLLFLSAGCSEPIFPGLAPADLGVAFDANTDASNGGPDFGMREDGGPQLPPADEVVVLPYGSSARVELLTESDLAFLDVHFSIDTTGSFHDEIEALKRDLDSRIVPTLRTRVDDVAFGVSRFEDFPAAPFGESSDRPFTLVSAVTTSISRVESAVASLDMPLGRGGDGPESGAEALYQIASGEGFPGGLIAPFNGVAAPGGGTRAGVGFREGALAVVVHVTDAPTHVPSDYDGSYDGTHSLAQAIDALHAEGIYMVGIASGDDARPYLEEVAIGTNAVEAPTDDACETGIDGATRSPVRGVCPLVFDVAGDGTGLSDRLADALIRLLDTVGIHEAFGTTTSDPFRFVRAIEASSSNPPTGFPAPASIDVRPSGDGIDDTFVEVPTGTRMRFVAHLENSLIEPTDYDQIFRVTITIRGDALTLAERVIRVIVPAVHMPMDAGMAVDADHDAENGD